MRILENGRANTTSEPVQVYAIDRNTRTLAIDGTFSGALVTVQYSSDLKEWYNVVNAEDVEETKTGTMYSYTGWMRVVIDGGVPFVDAPKEPLVWRCNMWYEKNIVVNIDGKYFICNNSHDDGSVPNWEYWSPYSWNPVIPDNSEATQINVDLL